MPGAGYVTTHEYGDRSSIGKTVGVTREEFDRLAFKVLAMAGENFATWSLPCHDLPVAWKAPDYVLGGAVEGVCCPAMPEGSVAIGFHRDLMVVLDEEPGRR